MIRSRTWCELAEYDLETADVMMRNGRYLYVAFMCHQAVEKMLKACYAKLASKVPPRIHDLEVLARRSEVYDGMSQDQKAFLRQLEPLNIESRYPPDRQLLANSLTAERCRSMLATTKEMYEWIKQRLSE